MHGPPGAGKSALAARVAAQQYVPHLQIGAMVDAALNGVRVCVRVCGFFGGRQI